MQSKRETNNKIDGGMKKMINKEEFKEIAKALNKANTEQLWFTQKYIESLINDKINVAATNSGLIVTEQTNTEETGIEGTDLEEDGIRVRE